MMMQRFLFPFLCLLLLCKVQTLRGATVDTVLAYSAAMKKNIPAVVVTPEGYAPETSFPVVYLLHGFGGSFRDWIVRVPSLKAAADHYGLILVCPDGDRSWYMDSPADPAFQYETFTAGELVRWIDQRYRTIKSPAGRAITGLSMGGHGALYLALRHPDVFGAGGSMSGGVDLRPFPTKWDLAKRLGPYAEQPGRWEQHSVINLVHLLVPGRLRLIIDCGTEDFFFTVNRNLHEKLLERNIPHDFIVRPGAHNWGYWESAVDYQILFFFKYFQEAK